MKRSILHIIFIVLIILFSISCDKEEKPKFDTLVEEVNYLVNQKLKMGAAIGIIDRQNQEIKMYYGRVSKNDSNPPDEHSVFDIGSITKTFTNTLLAIKILEKKVTLNSRAGLFLPPGEVTIPTGTDSVITIRHLACHTSGLPKSPHSSNQPLPLNYDPLNPYSAYTAEYVYEYLTSWCQLVYEPGTHYHYSNTGGGLLGHILGRIDQSTFQESVTQNVFNPLEMNETSLFLTPDQLSNLAPGHDDGLDSVANYTANDIFQGAGFMKSSLHDMMIYLKAQLGLIQTPLSNAIELTHVPVYELGGVTYDDRDGYFNLSIGLGWHIHEIPGSYTYYWHGGRTNGYMAYMAFIPDESIGIVVLFNHSRLNVILGLGDKLIDVVTKY